VSAVPIGWRASTNVQMSHRIELTHVWRDAEAVTQVVASSATRFLPTVMKNVKPYRRWQTAEQIADLACGIFFVNQFDFR
jgi:hypothetical protein